MEPDRKRGLWILFGLAVAMGLFLMVGTWIWDYVEMAGAGG
jgi:hypothetical protein